MVGVVAVGLLIICQGFFEVAALRRNLSHQHHAIEIVRFGFVSGLRKGLGQKWLPLIDQLKASESVERRAIGEAFERRAYQAIEFIRFAKLAIGPQICLLYTSDAADD